VPLHVPVQRGPRRYFSDTLLGLGASSVLDLGVS